MTAPLPDELSKQYRMRFAGLDAYRNGVWQVLCRDFFSKLIRADATVLDLGAGWGEFINNISAKSKWAMDLNPETRGRIQRSTAFLHQDCSQRWALESGVLDVVFTSNFLEHLPDKQSVERAMGEAFRCLRPGGILVCLGPNIRYTGGAYWDFWDHHTALTERSLSEVLCLAGFGIHKSLPRFLPYSMSTGRTYPLIVLKAYLRLPPLWRVFGKQFLVIARKPLSATAASGGVSE